MSQNASGFLTALGKDDDEDDVPRRRKKRTAPAADQAAAPEAPAAEADPEQAPPADEVAPPALTPSQRRAAERRTVVEDVPVPEAAPARPKVPEPVHKTSVDLRWSLKVALGELVDRDRRGPKAELNDALEAWLKAKGIEIPEWKG